MIQSSKNTNFSLKMGHLGPHLTTPMTTFHFGPTPKLFYGHYRPSTNPKSCQKRSEDLLKKRYYDSSVPQIDPLKLLLLITIL